MGDVAIGLSLVCLDASLFVTVINEFIAQLLNLRGKQLRDSLTSVIGDGAVVTILSQSPALKPFFDSKTMKLPSYLRASALGMHFP